MADIGVGARRICLVAILIVTLVGCAEDVGTSAASPTGSPTVKPSPSESPAATCDKPALTEIDLEVKNVHFNLRCIVVPTGQPLQVEFANKDSVNHNLSIHVLESSNVFTGDVAYPAETFRYEVPALEAGQYLFQCDIHPRDMSGPLIVE